MSREFIAILIIALILFQCDFEETNQVDLRPAVPSVTNIKISDIDNSNTSSDLTVTFTEPTDKSVIAEYQLVIVPIAGFEEITLEIVRRNDKGNYFKIPVGRAEEHVRLSDDVKDLFGNALIEETNYIAFVLSISADNGYNDKLSSNSNVFKLSRFATAVSNISLLDVGNTNSPSDLRVEFSEPVNNTSILEYRLLVTARDFMLTPEVAIQAEEGEYISFEKGSGEYAKELPDNLQTIDGVNIREENELALHILSIPDGVAANESSLSQAVGFTLKNESFIKTISTNFNGNGGIIIANNGEILVTNLGSVNSPQGQGITIFDPVSQTIEKIPTSFRGGFGGAAEGDGVFFASAKEPIVLYYDLIADELEIFYSSPGTGPKLETATDVAILNGSKFVAACNGVYNLAESAFNDNIEIRPVQTVGLSCPVNLEFNGQGHAFILNRQSNTIQYTPTFFQDGSTTTLVTFPDLVTSISFSLERDRLYAITEAGKLYEVNYRTKTYELIAGSDGAIQDGAALQAGILRPHYLAVSDADDAIYFTDWASDEGSIQNVVLKKFEFKR